eukprot:TRINITY_DN12698_c0_g1_i1.p1 TRINITY_DN12698_c0_g1~~TRINITY_DN12698_c0_g1_i1.p1  ORF type:complete len:211 (-),score=65.99 TRINITY_DN12698_c0_g1_i1:74-679(-)
MGISRDSLHKRRATGGKRALIRMKRKYELGRPAANTRLGPKRVRSVRARGGNIKTRALRLDHGNFSWGTEAITRKTRLLGVVYNASNNELVRTNTLVKSAIVQIDAGPFKQWYESHYGANIGKKKSDTTTAEPVKRSKRLQAKLAARAKNQNLNEKIDDQFSAGRLLACVSSRPGQSGRCDGYILEGPELEFYQRRLNKKH